MAAYAICAALDPGYYATRSPACRPRLGEGAGSDISGHGQGEDKSRFEELHRLVGMWSGGGVELKLGGSRQADGILYLGQPRPVRED